MKFRKLFINSRLWVRVCRARRELKRLKLELKRERISNSREKRSLIKHYEVQLAQERTRNETLHLAWADRWLQREKLATLSVSTTLIKENSNLKLPEEFITPDVDDENYTLNAAQMFELQDRREHFFQEGLSMGKSPAEITNRWKDIEPEVMQDVRLSVN